MLQKLFFIPLLLSLKVTVKATFFPSLTLPEKRKKLTKSFFSNKSGHYLIPVGYSLPREPGDLRNTVL